MNKNCPNSSFWTKNCINGYYTIKNSFFAQLNCVIAFNAINQCRLHFYFFACYLPQCGNLNPLSNLYLIEDSDVTDDVISNFSVFNINLNMKAKSEIRQTKCPREIQKIPPFTKWVRSTLPHLHHYHSYDIFNTFVNFHQ